MKILLFGKNGQLGWELQRSLLPLGQVLSVGRKDVNMEDMNALSKCVQQFQPDIVVNAAAYTAVDKAESEPEKAYLINSEAVGVLASEANKYNAWLVHFSTDYVFDGKKSSPYDEEDKSIPLSIYGKSKLGGEKLIQKNHTKYLIFRTSWVYGAHGHNFAKTILKLAKEKEELKIINDQFGAPTSAELIADITALALFKIGQTTNFEDYRGIYHLTASGETSWHGFAQAIIERAHLYKNIRIRTLPESVKTITTNEYPVAATRPKNSRLTTSKLCKKFNVYLPDWHYHMHRLIDELGVKEVF